MGFLTVRTVVNVDIWCLLLFHPNTAETRRETVITLPQSPSAASIRKLTAGKQVQWSCLGHWSWERDGIHTQLQRLTGRTQWLCHSSSKPASVRTIITLRG